MTDQIRRRVSGLDWFGMAMCRAAVGVMLGLLAGIGYGQAQTCPTPVAPEAGAAVGIDYWVGGQFVGDPDMYEEFEFRYQFIDRPGWTSAAPGTTIDVDHTEFEAHLVPPPPVTGSNPGIYEVQVRGRCGTMWSEWSPSSAPANANDLPRFTDRFTDPLGVGENTCTFVEGQTDSGDAGLGCRIFADDPDISRHPLHGDEVQLEIGGDDAEFFRFSIDRHRIFDGVGDSKRLDGYYLVHFRIPANFERSDQPDGIYHLTLKTTDAYGLSGTQDFVMRVTDVDESETWTLAPPPPSGANHHRDPHGW